MHWIIGSRVFGATVLVIRTWYEGLYIRQTIEMMMSSIIDIAYPIINSIKRFWPCDIWPSLHWVCSLWGLSGRCVTIIRWFWSLNNALCFTIFTAVDHVSYVISYINYLARLFSFLFFSPRVFIDITKILVCRAVTSPSMRENPKFFIQIAVFFFLAYVMIVSSLILTDV